MTAVHHAIKPLPVVLKPVDDELLSSWIARHADFYQVSPLAMLRHCLSDTASLKAADLRLNAEQEAQIGRIFRAPSAYIRRMTHADVPESAVLLLAPRPIQTCLACSRENARRGAAVARSKNSVEGWRITCRVCDSELDECGEPRSRERFILFPNLWDSALKGQSLFETAIVHNDWPWASPIHVLRLLLVRRFCNRADHIERLEHGRTVNLIIPTFDKTIQQLGLDLRQRARWLFIPLSIRPALLAAVSAVIDEGADTLLLLSEATLGSYRVQFDNIVSQMQDEIRIRQTVSELLQL
jgi:hypothetical protein